ETPATWKASSRRSRARSRCRRSSRRHSPRMRRRRSTSKACPTAERSGSWRRSQTARRLKRASGTSTKRWRRCGPERLRKAPPHSWGGGGGAAGGVGGAGSADQRPQRLFGSPPQLPSDKYADDAAPPPGREVEVSIEPDQRPAFRG